MNQQTRLPDWVGRFHSSWIWQHLLFPFITSRLVLILIAWFTRYFTPSYQYWAQYIQQGYFLTPNFLVDIWSRWDGQWYLSIIQNGYVPTADLTVQKSNIAFFPLYPYLVHFLTLPFQLIKRPSANFILLAGILLSNLLFLVAAYLLYKLVVELFHDETIARRTLILLIAFPFGFIFSTFYPESLFLLLSVAVFYTAWRKKWLWAAMLCSLAAVTRPQGILLALPIAWFYMDARRWKLRAIQLDVLYFLIVPILLAAHIIYTHSLTNDWLALIHVQYPWGRFENSARGDLLQQLSADNHYVFEVDISLYLIFAAAAIYALFKFPSKAFGVYAIAMLALPLLTQNWESLSRYLIAIFPVFIILGWASRKRELYILMLAFFIAIQALYYFGWVNYYFVG